MAKNQMIAAAAAALFATAFATAASAADVKCMGINTCKGTGACKTAENGCKGQNTCKGHGWTPSASAKECTDKGGKVV
jgi:hypothetical protein